MKGLSLGFALSFALVAYLRPDFYQILLNFDFISYEDVAQWSGLKVDGEKLGIIINTAWAWPVTVFLTWGCGLLLPRKENEPARIIPTPRKVSETGNSFILPQELRFFCSDESLSEGILHGQENFLLNRQNFEEANLHVQKESLGHPEAYSLKLENDQIILKAEVHRVYSEAIQSISDISVSATGHTDTGIRDRGRSQPEPEGLHARY